MCSFSILPYPCLGLFLSIVPTSILLRSLYPGLAIPAGAAWLRSVLSPAVDKHPGQPEDRLAQASGSRDGACC